jgi:predicted membrane protein (TIGR00267 family)
MREIVFGLEDSLVSTLGTLTGVAAGTQSHYIVVLSGLVIVAVEATSMAAGSYLSTKSSEAAEHAYEKMNGTRGHHDGISPRRSAAVMGAFYFAGGFVPLTPYLLFPVDLAFVPSIALTGIALFGLGWWSATFTKEDRLKAGLEMFTVSMGASAVGYGIGWLVRNWFGVTV